ncbi:glucose-1-phosphate cytidylyltransferase [Natronincola ferrireducens]|uniref:Glucose-1-phosphate cytidylyltransferase n=1 Tax=Natronincola ferrireducens TaxID=393762 RepID=A0A1G9CR76_9FIRM|nr:glucose-1-phosphate cytidylyltransferase [Natronincola ferrireducens]SDK54127.1 glucose-1-phosphate cytidylyltransferase [Natronincola ferrireducens]
MKAVILCGGKGLRLGGDSSFPCKPLAKVGEMPILWHIIKIYMHYGINEFIFCLGHNGEAIKEYFLNFDWKNNDFKLRIGSNLKEIKFFNELDNLNITFIDTGLDTMTGGRIKRIQKYIDEDEFMLTYGDGVSDINLNQLIKFHRQKQKIATVTGVKHRSSYGIIDVKDGIATSFKEKPLQDGWINGGFFILRKEVFDYIDNDETIWENEPLRNLVQDNQLAVYQHEGFWQSIDTIKDLQIINEQWVNNDRQWVKW